MVNTKLASRAEIRKIDEAAIGQFGVAGIALMENAGASVARAAFRILAGEPGGCPARFSVVVFAGRGNNGGDGFVAARHLLGAGFNVRVYLLGESRNVEGDAGANLSILRSMGVCPEELCDDSPEHLWADVGATVRDAHVIIDAMLGTGARGEPSPAILRAIAIIRACARPVIAVDIPTGVDADTGACTSQCVRADTTVTFGLPKIGLVSYPGREFAGLIVVSPIGIPEALLESPAIQTNLTTPENVRAALRRRAPDDHKGDFGRVLVVAGSRGMAGAAALASSATLRSGAGLCVLACPELILDSLAAKVTEVILTPVPCTQAGSVSAEAIPHILTHARGCDAVVAGPGLGATDDTRAVVEALIRECPVPLVVDADGINVLAGNSAAFKAARSGVVVTPHPGELGRLMGVTPAEINSDRLRWAREAARTTGAVVVLKGAGTVIARPDGEAFINPMGNPGMATAGSGDVLAGVVGSLLAQGGEPFPSAVAGVFIHGLAGDLAAREMGQAGMVAGDMLLTLPRAIEMSMTLPGELWNMMPVRTERW
ncbi:MAG: NAD(P)H-hydrate dehydratase [Firmicutes bacterium]|nr:NAD(P)H-hydrate dehydratase [Bacillota bacterium]